MAEEAAKEAEALRAANAKARAEAEAAKQRVVQKRGGPHLTTERQERLESAMETGQLVADDGQLSARRKGGTTLAREMQKRSNEKRKSDLQTIQKLASDKDQAREQAEAAQAAQAAQAAEIAQLREELERAKSAGGGVGEIVTPAGDTLQFI